MTVTCAHVITSSVLYLQWVLLKQCPLISFLALIHEQMLMTVPFKLQSAIGRMQVGAKLSSFAVKHFSKILVALYYHQKNTILPLNCAPIKGLQVHW